MVFANLNGLYCARKKLPKSLKDSSISSGYGEYKGNFNLRKDNLTKSTNSFKGNIIKRNDFLNKNKENTSNDQCYNNRSRYKEITQKVINGEFNWNNELKNSYCMTLNLKQQSSPSRKLNEKEEGRVMPLESEIFGSVNPTKNNFINISSVIDSENTTPQKPETNNSNLKKINESAKDLIKDKEFKELLCTTSEICS
ncbi:uncharacterized protein I206_100515 [Kwoniella pini CBS 10737]|uniref:Uncharacterized protein n=1 Tax=Kwoniella pini CBS 10737 TaxID=1296096 RepID=A0A1B9IDF5_9TREE|nr:uncharacterized protein I206_00812 [Kwoniella pini CBS 10737]OCF53507.1 hypothetical protein I206_00812 [Kwoniella pini CBS 10737]